jgi:hypothetical protein
VRNVGLPGGGGAEDRDDRVPQSRS